jgi:peptide/nickel transport system permease protein
LTAPADAVVARQVVAYEHQSLARAAGRRFLRHRLAVIGLVLLAVIVLMAVFADVISSKPFFTDVKAVSQPPSANHLLGTDRSGRDVWARVVHGARTSLVVGIGAVGIYVTIGTLLGGLAGLRGGRVDFFIMRIVDTLMSIPTLLLVIVFVAAVGPSLASVVAGHRPAGLARRVPARPRPAALAPRGRSSCWRRGSSASARARSSSAT